MRNFVLTALVCLLAACSSGRGTPAAPQGVAPYGQPAGTAPQTRVVPGTRTMYSRAAPPTYAAAPTPRGGTFRWHTRIADAQAQARREGKLILVGSTKPSCSLCEKFKNQIVPSMGSQVSSVAVGYMIQAPTPGVRPEAPQIWAALVQHLRNAGLMPLVGVFSPDLRYLAGFGGPTDQGKLANALAQARRMHPVSLRVPPQPSAPRNLAGTMVSAQVNEFGEYEWTPVPLWPAEEIETERPVLAQASEPTPVDLPPADADPVLAEAPAQPAPDTWARTELERARDAIEAGQFAQARQILESVTRQVPGTEAAREAARGSVALYNAQKISGARASERASLQERAAKNLGESMWGPLFV